MPRATSRIATRSLLHDPATLNRLERLGARAIERVDPRENGGRRSVGLWEAATLGDRGGLYDSGATHVVLAAPLTAEGRIEGACVLLVPSAARIDPADALERLALTSPVRGVPVARQGAGGGRAASEAA